MIELLILWNVAAARADLGEDNDFSTGLIAVWIMLQILIWPLSILALLIKLGVHWLPSLIAASAFTTIGYLLWGENFYYSLGMIGMVAAACVVAKHVVDNGA